MNRAGSCWKGIICMVYGMRSSFTSLNYYGHSIVPLPFFLLINFMVMTHLTASQPGSRLNIPFIRIF